MDGTEIQEYLSIFLLSIGLVAECVFSIARSIVNDVGNPQGYTTRIISPLFAASMGAFFGVHYASRLARRNADRRLDLEELRSLLKVASLSAQVCNSAISLKRQYVKGLVEKYHSDRKIVLSILGIPTREKQIIKMEFDFRAISGFQSETLTLSHEINSNILAPEVLIQVSAALIASKNIEDLIFRRNAWILEFRAQQLADHPAVALYFGFPNGNGSLDTTYFDLVTALDSCTDDLIFHSYMINHRVSNMLIDKTEEYRKSFGTAPFSIPIFGFNLPDKLELLPDFSQYREWMTESQKLEKPKHKTWSAYYTDLRKHFLLPDNVNPPNSS